MEREVAAHLGLAGARARGDGDVGGGVEGRVREPVGIESLVVQPLVALLVATVELAQVDADACVPGDEALGRRDDVGRAGDRRRAPDDVGRRAHAGHVHVDRVVGA